MPLCTVNIPVLGTSKCLNSGSINNSVTNNSAYKRKMKHISFNFLLCYLSCCQINLVASLKRTEQENKSCLKLWGEKGSWVKGANNVAKYHIDFDTRADRTAASKTCFEYYNLVRTRPLTDYSFYWNVNNDRDGSTNNKLSACKSEYNSQWSLNRFCNALGNKTIMIVGDSLNLHFYFTMLLMTTGDTSYNNIVCDEYTKITVLFIRNDYLHIESVTPKDENDNYAVGDALPWESYILSHNVSQLLLNRGMHYRNDDLVLRHMSTLFTYLESKYPELVIMFRSSTAGHIDCVNNFESPPMLEYQDWNSIVYDDFDKRAPNYHWKDIYVQNQLIKNLLIEKFPKIYYMDVERLTRLRQDHHTGLAGDCAHYCFYSVVDDWVIFFTNTVELLLQ